MYCNYKTHFIAKCCKPFLTQCFILWKKNTPLLPLHPYTCFCIPVTSRWSCDHSTLATRETPTKISLARWRPSVRFSVRSKKSYKCFKNSFHCGLNIFYPSRGLIHTTWFWWVFIFSSAYSKILLQTLFSSFFPLREKKFRRFRTWNSG